MTSELARRWKLPLWLIREHVGRRPFPGGESAEHDLAPPYGWSPAMNLYRDGDRLVLTIDLPGVAPGDVEVWVDDGVLRVSGYRRPACQCGAGDVYLQEAPRGRFSRSLRLPEPVEAARLVSTVTNGTVVVELPLVREQVEAVPRGEGPHPAERELGAAEARGDTAVGGGPP